MTRQGVTVVVSREVLAGREAEYEAALARHLQDACGAEGHLGVNVLRPPPGSREWTCVFRFDNATNLGSWMDSEVRCAWEDRASSLTTRQVHFRRLAGAEAWLSPAVPGIPPRWKHAIATWIAIYPTITTLVLTTGAELDALPTPVRTLLLTGLLVPLMTFVLMPAVTRALHPWLHPTTWKPSWQTTP